LADTRRLADSFSPIDFFEERGLPYIIGVNCFDGKLHHKLDDVRDALAIDPQVPIVRCDARDRESTKQTLITLVEYSVERWIAANGVAAHT
ncbi:ATP-binding protein, partial [Kibdelosporangium lantanae]